MGLSLVVELRLLDAQALVVAARGLDRYGTWAPPGPEIEFMSPELAGGFLSTLLPGKSHKTLNYIVVCA